MLFKYTAHIEYGNFIKNYLKSLLTSLVAWTVKCLPIMWETQVRSMGQSLWRKKWQPTPVLLLGKSNGQRSVVGYSPWVSGSI